MFTQLIFILCSSSLFVCKSIGGIAVTTSSFLISGFSDFAVTRSSPCVINGYHQRNIVVLWSEGDTCINVINVCPILSYVVAELVHSSLATAIGKEKPYIAGPEN